MSLWGLLKEALGTIFMGLGARLLPETRAVEALLEGLQKYRHLRKAELNDQIQTMERDEDE
jgi:hypothetical protein